MILSYYCPTCGDTADVVDSYHNGRACTMCADCGMLLVIGGHKIYG